MHFPYFSLISVYLKDKIIIIILSVFTLRRDLLSTLQLLFFSSSHLGDTMAWCAPGLSGFSVFRSCNHAQAHVQRERETCTLLQRGRKRDALFL